MTRPLWQYYFARKFSASRFEIVMRVFTSPFYRKTFRANLANILVAPHDGNHAIYYVPTEWRLFADRVFRSVCRDWPTFARYRRDIQAVQRSSFRTAKQVSRGNLRRLSRRALGTRWERWDRAHLEHFLKPIWIPFIIEPLLAAEAESIVRKRAGGRIEEVTNAIFTPEEASAVPQERMSMLRIAIAVRRGTLSARARDALLLRHYKQYSFIPSYDVIDTPWPLSHFQQECTKLAQKSLATLQQELRLISNKFRRARRAYIRVIRSLRLTKHERDMLRMAHAMVFIKDERDDYRRRQSHAAQPLFAEIARRGGLPFRAPLYLLHHEMKRWFRSGTLPMTKKLLLERIRAYCLVILDGRSVEVMSGARMRSFLRRQRFVKSGDVGTRIIRGLTGSGGSARGRVIIVRTVHNLGRVTHGSVLVAVTTNPDYVPAMRKAAAFITDEGGITSHAAIVARELKKPCIVGTKIATQMLKDGDMVEVDATRGVVKKL